MAGKHKSRGIMRRMKRLSYLLILIFLLSACQTVEETPQTSLFPGMGLTPFATNTLTPTVTSTPQNAPTATLAPTITPTPITYTIKGNDTLFSLAAKNGLTLDEIRTANPSINPYLLGPGTIIIIPAPSGKTSTQVVAPDTTPYPLTIVEPGCTPSLSGGFYCFAELTNDQDLMLGNITAEFRLANPANNEVLTQKALVPLNRIASGGSLPLFAYFPPPVAANSVVSLMINSAASVGQSDPSSAFHSAVVKVDNSEVLISANGLSVAVTSQAMFEGVDGVTGKIWIAAVAYDSTNQVVGIRRFTSDSAVNPGERVPFSLNVYSIGGKIDRVDLFGEVNP